MSNIFIPTEEQLKELEIWKLTRPEIIQRMIEKFPPYKLYKIKETNQNATIYSYSEDGTITVNIFEKYNPHLVMFADLQVFGIKQESLAESAFIIEKGD